MNNPLAENTNMIPPKILENLKQYPKHRNVTCLECGYVGIAGIKKNGRRWVWSFFIALFYTILLAMFGVWGLFLSGCIFGGVYGVAWQVTAKPTVSCPSCNQELKVK